MFFFSLDRKHRKYSSYNIILLFKKYYIMENYMLFWHMDYFNQNNILWTMSIPKNSLFFMLIMPFKNTYNPTYSYYLVYL
jgi:hypothetical protein